MASRKKVEGHVYSYATLHGRKQDERITTEEVNWWH